MFKPRRRIFQSTFSRIFVGIVLTSTFALTIAEILSYTQLKNSFDRFASRQIIVLQQIGREFFVKEDITMPADYQNFVAEYKEEINRQVFFSFGAGLFLSLIAGALISREITRPIATLKNIIIRVTKERYSIRAPESGSLEIRELTTAFNHLIDELEEQENLRQELLADMSHELKTPITKIRGQIEGIIDGIYQPKSDTFSKILVNIKQLEYLIQALYEVNQLSPQDIRLKLEKVKVKPLVEAAVSGLIKSDLSFNVDIDPKLTIVADRFRLRQIIDNLINNAFKYTKTGTITVKANHEVLIVKDTGIGIDAQHLSHIFERLYRVEKSRSKETGGLGLGLYIVKKLVTLHGWTIEASSHKNHGTTFTLVWKR